MPDAQKYFSAREAAEKFKKDEKTIKARAAEAGVAVAWFNGAACFSRKGLEKLWLTCKVPWKSTQRSCIA